MVVFTVYQTQHIKKACICFQTRNTAKARHGQTKRSITFIHPSQSARASIEPFATEPPTEWPEIRLSESVKSTTHHLPVSQRIAFTSHHQSPFGKTNYSSPMQPESKWPHVGSFFGLRWQMTRTHAHLDCQWQTRFIFLRWNLPAFLWDGFVQLSEYFNVCSRMYTNVYVLQTFGVTPESRSAPLWSFCVWYDYRKFSIIAYFS